jgi:hypothetical protein
MQPPPQRWVPLFGVILLTLFMRSGNARANGDATAPDNINYRTDGIRFQIKASVKASPAAPILEYDHGVASLTVKIRISSHARESQFFGTISKNFSDFSLNAGSATKLFWQDPRCHQRRGLPKTTVIGIDGSIVTAKEEINVHARPRQLGLLLPADEITQEIRQPSGDKSDGPLIDFRSRTERSHLLVDVKIYAFSCDLTAARSHLVPGQPGSLSGSNGASK